MKRIGIAVDSGSGITQEEGKKLGIYVMPITFCIDGKEYKEGVDITYDRFYEFLKSGAEVFTSQPAVYDLMQFWNKCLEENDELIYIPLSSSLSSSYQTARTFAEEEYKDRVFAVDNQRVSVTQRLSAIEAKMMADKGKSAAEIVRILEETKAESSIYIVVDTLKYLKKGGRITAAGAALATVLNIKPVLTIQGGKLDAFVKVRGMKAGKAAMIKAVRDDIENRFGGMDGAADRLEMQIAHTSEDETVAEFEKEVREAFPGFDVVTNKLSLPIACHIGEGSLAMAVSVKHY